MECLCAGARNALLLGHVAVLLLIVSHLVVTFNHHGARNDLLALLHHFAFIADLAIVVFHALHLPSQLLLFPLSFFPRERGSALFRKMFLDGIDFTAQLCKGVSAVGAVGILPCRESARKLWRGRSGKSIPLVATYQRAIDHSESALSIRSSASERSAKHAAMSKKNLMR